MLDLSEGIFHALPAVVIIILVGIVIGAWIGGGIVATMFYYGLKLISPAFFLVFYCRYMCDRLYCDGKLMVNDGNNRNCGNGNRNEYGGLLQVWSLGPLFQEPILEIKCLLFQTPRI